MSTNAKDLHDALKACGMTAWLTKSGHVPPQRHPEPPAPCKSMDGYDKARLQMALNYVRNRLDKSAGPTDILPLAERLLALYAAQCSELLLHSMDMTSTEVNACRWTIYTMERLMTVRRIADPLRPVSWTTGHFHTTYPGLQDSEWAIIHLCVKLRRREIYDRYSNFAQYLAKRLVSTPTRRTRSSPQTICTSLEKAFSTTHKQLRAMKPTKIAFLAERLQHESPYGYRSYHRVWYDSSRNRQSRPATTLLFETVSYFHAPGTALKIDFKNLIGDSEGEYVWNQNRVRVGELGSIRGFAANERHFETCLQKVILAGYWGDVAQILGADLCDLDHVFGVEDRVEVELIRSTIRCLCATWFDAKPRDGCSDTYNQALQDPKRWLPNNAWIKRIRSPAQEPRAQGIKTNPAADAADAKLDHANCEVIRAIDGALAAEVAIPYDDREALTRLLIRQHDPRENTCTCSQQRPSAGFAGPAKTRLNMFREVIESYRSMREKRDEFYIDEGFKTGLDITGRRACELIELSKIGCDCRQGEHQAK